MTYFVSLKIVALIVGLLYVLMHLPVALAPVRLTPLLRSLPRNYPLGVVLMLLATLWFTTLTAYMDLGEISNIRHQLMAVWAIAGILMVVLVPAFLTARGIGCLLLLGAALLLDACFLATTPWRYLLTVLAYFWAIAGAVFVYSPHLFRDVVFFATATPRRLVSFAWPGVAYGAALIVLALVVYPW
jgi:hypothetical protein